jgi:hypothetical protein
MQDIDGICVVRSKVGKRNLTLAQNLQDTGVNISHYYQIFNLGKVSLFWRIWGRVCPIFSFINI